MKNNQNFDSNSNSTPSLNEKIELVKKALAQSSNSNTNQNKNPNDDLAYGEQKPEFELERDNRNKFKYYDCPFCGEHKFTPYVYKNNFRDKRAGDYVDFSVTGFGMCFKGKCKFHGGISPNYVNGFRYSMAGKKPSNVSSTSVSFTPNFNIIKKVNNISNQQNIISNHQNIISNKQNIISTYSTPLVTPPNDIAYTSTMPSNSTLPSLEYSSELFPEEEKYDILDKDWLRTYSTSYTQHKYGYTITTSGNLNHYECGLYDYLNKFSIEHVKRTFNQMCVSGGITKHIYGKDLNLTSTSTVYWLKDLEGNILDGILVYLNANGHRIKNKNFEHLGIKIEDFGFHVSWVHSLYENYQMYEKHNLDYKYNDKKIPFGLYNLKQCVKEKGVENVNVYVTEAPKTATILKVLYPDPQYAFISVLSLGGLKTQMLKDLKTLNIKKICLLPDKGEGYKRWNEKKDRIANELGIEILIDNYLEYRDDLQEGADLIDIHDKKEKISIPRIID